MVRYGSRHVSYPLSRVKSTDSDGLKCWKELVGRLPSATPNPRGFLTEDAEAESSEFSRVAWTAQCL